MKTDIENAFGVAQGTVSVAVRTVCCVINDVMRPKYIKLPKKEKEVEELTNNVEKRNGFPHC